MHFMPATHCRLGSGQLVRKDFRFMPCGSVAVEACNRLKNCERPSSQEENKREAETQFRKRVEFVAATTKFCRRREAIVYKLGGEKKKTEITNWSTQHCPYIEEQAITNFWSKCY